MKKYIRNFLITETKKLNERYALLKLTHPLPIGEVRPGQFCEVEVKSSKSTFLRRPISVNFVEPAKNELWLLIRDAGAGTHALIEARVGESLSIMMPLGKGFSVPPDSTSKILLAGGGVGVAPLLYFGKVLKDLRFDVSFLLAARSKTDLLELDEFRKYGEVYLSTDDGSYGEPGLITANSALNKVWDRIACCGPMPMMRAVAAYARERDIECEVSLENVMACGLGACLCCVEDTVAGNVCVCKEGPVFNIKQLKW